MAYTQRWGISRKSSPLNNDYDPKYKGNVENILKEVEIEAANYAPEYDPPPTQEQREEDPNYKFFITNRNRKSDKVAKKLDSLKYHINAPNKTSTFVQKNLQMQRRLLKKHGLK